MAVSRERLDQLYNELFDRTTGAEDAGAEYWMNSGLTGEKLRDALVAGAASNPTGQDYVNFQAAQEQFGQNSYAQRASDVNQMYLELFGRPAEEGGLLYWVNSGLSGEELRDSIAYAGMKNPKQDDYESYLNRQSSLAAGETPEGYKTYSQSAPPGYFTELQDQFTAMQEEIAALNLLLAEQQGGGGYSPTMPVGQPGGGVVSSEGGGGYSYTVPSVVPPMDNPYLAQFPTNPPVGYVPPTPELLDAYRYEQFYNQGMVPPVDQGIGGLSYFGIPPSQIQASLAGF